MIRRAVAAAVLLLAAPVAAQQSQPDPGALLREMWGKTNKPTITITQQLYSRILSINLPRPFVVAYQAQREGFFIIEYIPNGESLTNWTQMITVTANQYMGAAKVEDSAIADLMFNKLSCPGRRYTDFGVVPSATSVHQRALVIGCDATAANAYAGAVPEAGERTAIAFLRDDDHVWTVQFAQRSLPGQGQALFDPKTAAARLAGLGILACAEADATPPCREARQIEGLRKGQPAS